MNQLLFDRSTGNLNPQAFARLHTSTLLHATQLAPKLRFNGGEKEEVVRGRAASANINVPVDSLETKIWAHQAGVNALALDKFDGRM